MATMSPLFKRALCTCAKEALPKGLGSMASKISLQGTLYTSSSAALTSSKVIGEASIWSFSSSSQYALGKISERVESA